MNMNCGKNTGTFNLNLLLIVHILPCICRNPDIKTLSDLILPLKLKPYNLFINCRYFSHITLNRFGYAATKVAIQCGNGETYCIDGLIIETDCPFNPTGRLN
jgi:hypothetical protein